MKGFNSDRFRELFEANPWSSIEEILEAVKEDGVLSEEFHENASDAAALAAIRSELNRRDPETGEPYGVSVVGTDGERRYKSPKLFDDSDCRVVIRDRQKRIIHYCEEIRHYERKAGIPPSEQTSFDFTWIDEEEDEQEGAA